MAQEVPAAPVPTLAAAVQVPTLAAAVLTLAVATTTLAHQDNPVHQALLAAPDTLVLLALLAILARLDLTLVDLVIFLK